MEDYKKLVEQLRSTVSVSKRRMLDAAADMIEAMEDEIKRLDTDCCACRHNQTRPQCDDVIGLCYECPFDCPCSTCRDNSNWEWRGPAAGKEK